MSTSAILVIGVGGLGARLVTEALDRGLSVSVLVRDPAKLDSALSAGARSRLTAVHVGDGTDSAVLGRATAGADVVLSGRGAAPDMAAAIAQAAVRNNVDKIVWPGGTTNVMAEDGVTPNYRRLTALGPWVDGAYRAHQACIDVIRDSGVNYVIFCPGRMGPADHRSADVMATVRVNRDAGPFVSYEDAAWAILEAATTSQWDRELVSAATPPPRGLSRRHVGQGEAAVERELARFDGRHLSTEVAGGFTGRLVGVRAIGGVTRIEDFAYRAASAV